MPEARAFAAELLEQVNPRVLQVGLHRAVRGWQSPPRHLVLPDFDLWYVAQGRGAVAVDGVWQEFEAGDVVVIRPGRACTGERGSYDEPFVVYFSHLLPFGARDDVREQALAGDWPLRLSLRHRSELLTVHEALLDAWVLSGGRTSLRVRGLAQQLLGILVEELSGERGTAATLPRRVLAAREFLEARLSHPVSVREVADHVDLSVSHLSALFTRYLGAPPNEYLLKVRLREARVLLARGLSVKETAHATGFRSQQYFSRLFHRRLGLTPTAFASNFRRETMG